MSLKLMPALSQLARPQNSIPAGVKTSHGSPIDGRIAGANRPWKARLWIVNTDGTSARLASAASGRRR